MQVDNLNIFVAVKRILISWILISLLMYGVSLFWHGYVLNDLYNLKFPLGWFLFYSFLSYLLIGAIMCFALGSVFQQISFVKGLFLGSLVGFGLYLLVFVLGLSFKTSDLNHIIFDFLWQMIEQGIGGGVLVIYNFIYDRSLAHR